MCGRFTSLLSPELLSDLFDVPAPASIEPRYNIAPTQRVPIIREDPDQGRYLTDVRWGRTPSWANDLSIGSSQVNTRLEDMADESAFGCQSTNSRCIIPANGFYIWELADTSRQPWYVTHRDGTPMALAGLLQQWKTPGGAQLEICTIITTAAISLIRPIHDRMPATVSPEDFQRWLAPSPLSAAELHSILGEQPSETVQLFPVCSLVNRPACNSPDCIRRLHCS